MKYDPLIERKLKLPKTISVLWNLLDSWKDWSWSWSNLLKWKRFWWKNANKLRGQDRGLLLRGPAWYQLDLDLLGPLHQWFYRVLVLPWLTIIPATIGNKLYQLHLHSRAFQDIITINQSIPTCQLCHGSKCLEWGQGCPCQQYSSHLYFKCHVQLFRECTAYSQSTNASTCIWY